MNHQPTIIMSQSTPSPPTMLLLLLTTSLSTQSPPIMLPLLHTMSQLPLTISLLLTMPLFTLLIMLPTTRLTRSMTRPQYTIRDRRQQALPFPPLSLVFPHYLTTVLSSYYSFACDCDPTQFYIL